MALEVAVMITSSRDIIDFCPAICPRGISLIPAETKFETIELRKTRLSQLALDDLKGPDLENVFDLKVGDQEDSKFSIRVYVPSKIKTNEKVPVILFFHGGGFVMGNLETHDYPCRCIAKFSEMSAKILKESTLFGLHLDVGPVRKCENLVDFENDRKI